MRGAGVNRSAIVKPPGDWLGAVEIVLQAADWSQAGDCGEPIEAVESQAGPDWTLSPTPVIAGAVQKVISEPTESTDETIDFSNPFGMPAQWAMAPLAKPPNDTASTSNQSRKGRPIRRIALVYDKSSRVGYLTRRRVLDGWETGPRGAVAGGELLRCWPRCRWCAGDQAAIRVGAWIAPVFSFSS